MSERGESHRRSVVPVNGFARSRSASARGKVWPPLSEKPAEQQTSALQCVPSDDTEVYDKFPSDPRETEKIRGAHADRTLVCPELKVTIVDMWSGGEAAPFTSS